MLLDDPRSPAAKLLSHADTLTHYQQALQDWIVTAYPEQTDIAKDPGVAFGNALRVANLRNGTLVIHAENAATLTALRYRTNDLLRALQSVSNLECDRIQIKVKPNLPRDE